jgi:hypothetical protein
MAHISSIIYSIWYARNQRVFKNQMLPSIDVSNKAMTLLHEYQLTNAIQPSLHRPNQPETSNHNISWNPPSRGVLKINVDAHILHDGRCFSGMILRRWDGSTIGIATRAHPSVTDAIEGEALGLNDAIDMVESHNCTEVIFELDNQVITRAVQRRRVYHI